MDDPAPRGETSDDDPPLRRRDGVLKLMLDIITRRRQRHVSDGSTELTITFPRNYPFSHYKASTFTRKTEHSRRTSTLSLTAAA